MSADPPDSLAQRQRRALVATAAIAAIGTVAFFVTSGTTKADLWNLTTGLLLIAMAANIIRFQAERHKPWSLVWLGLALAYGGGLVLAYGGSFGYQPESPSIVDAMRLSNYVLATLGALFVLAQYDRRTGARATLETVMVTATGAMIIWFYVGLPTIESADLSTAQTVVAAGYPIGNVLLLAVISTVVIRLVHRPGSLILLTLGLAGNLTADFLFGVQNLRGTYEPGGWIDLGWLLCFAGLAMGPAWPDPTTGVGQDELLAAEQGHLTSGRFAMLAFALLLGPMILIDRTVEFATASDVLVVAGSALVSVLAVARLVLHNSDLASTEAEVRATSEQLLAANEELAEAKSERQKLLWRVQRAVEEERTRIAADIHDRPLQELTVVGYQLERISLALARGDIDLAEEIVDGAAEGLTAQLGELRMIMTEIRPPVLDERGLEGALEDSAARFMSKHSDVCVTVTFAVDALDSEVETAFYRVVQESLTNVARHAGPCDVHIELASTESDTVLTIADSGTGFRHTDIGRLVADGHFGMAGMRERISMLDGQMAVESTPAKGTTLRFTVPLEAGTGPPGMSTPLLAGVIT